MLMNDLLMHIKTTSDVNDHLRDDNIVHECMNSLIRKYPQITGYQYERVDGGINILLWGHLEFW